ncbi:MAG: 5'-methylthioadenosine/adenosylhomocysteine nucleosidase [Ruminococcaceae bacterium]|nr:5'-methylthioadenosine/adenosylhomocysteine nucleosidase [Oscillospiraceae bacterium]
MIGIIGAMSVEVEGLKSKITDAKSEIVCGAEYVSGKLCGKDVVVAQCGVGKVFASVCASTMILKYNVSAIINTGVAGTLVSFLNILDFAVSSFVVQHDMDTTAIGDAPGLISGINIVEIPASRRLSSLALNIATEQGTACARGVIASGDQFISNQEKKDYIRETFGAIACEMEGAAIGHVCYLADVEFIVIRCISDSATGDAEMEYPEMVSRAAVKSEALVLAMLEAMED